MNYTFRSAHRRCCVDADDCVGWDDGNGADGGCDDGCCYCCSGCVGGEDEADDCCCCVAGVVGFADDDDDCVVFHHAVHADDEDLVDIRHQCRHFHAVAAGPDSNCNSRDGFAKIVSGCLDSRLRHRCWSVVGDGAAVTGWPKRKAFFRSYCCCPVEWCVRRQIVPWVDGDDGGGDGRCCVQFSGADALIWLSDR